MPISLDVVSLVLGAAVPLLGLLFTLAVAWGRFGQIIQDLVTALKELRAELGEIRQELGVVRTEQARLRAEGESASERLDRLELPLFTRR